jgi:hypothetical protein
MAADRWSSAAGIQLLKSSLMEVIPQWKPTGPYDWQTEATANILDNNNQLLIAGCGDGKTAVTYLHLIFRHKVLPNLGQTQFATRVVEHPIVLIVTPLTCFESSKICCSMSY